MKKLNKIWKAILGSILALMLPAIVFAQSLLPPNNTSLPGNTQSTITGTIGGYIFIILRVVGILAVLFLIYGGFQYITSGGNEEQAEGGKKTIQNAIIGLVIIILSYIIVAVIVNALTANSGGAGV